MSGMPEPGAVQRVLQGDAALASLLECCADCLLKLLAKLVHVHDADLASPDLSGGAVRSVCKSSAGCAGVRASGVSTPRIHVRFTVKNAAGLLARDLQRGASVKLAEGGGASKSWHRSFPEALTPSLA